MTFTSIVSVESSPISRLSTIVRPLVSNLSKEIVVFLAIPVPVLDNVITISFQTLCLNGSDCKTVNSLKGNENCGTGADAIVESANFLASNTSSSNCAGSGLLERLRLTLRTFFLVPKSVKETLSAIIQA